MGSKIEEGVYRRPKAGEVESIQIDLNRASRTAGNGINLMSAHAIANVNGQEVALTLTRNAARRLADASYALLEVER